GGPTLAAGAGTSVPLSDRCLTGDFNGDGKVDLDCLTTSGASAQWSVALSAGRGWSVDVWDGGASPLGDAASTVAGSCVAGDFNGDHKTDIACYHTGSSSWRLLLSTGSNFAVANWGTGPAMPASPGPFPLLAHCLAGDFNGDGKTDMACYAGRVGNAEFDG